MTLHLGWWALPLATTILLWTALILWPLPPRRGDYDFSTAFDAALRFLAGMLATLAIWLVYTSARLILG